MRHTIAGLLLVFCCASLAAETYETRSKKYALTIDEVASGTDTQYDVRVTDLATNSVYVFPAISASRRGRAEGRMKQGDVDLQVWITPHAGAFTADLTATKAGQSNTLHTVWNATPPMVRLNIEDVLRVGGDVKAPVVLSRVEPHYPEAARADRISGIVIMEVLIDESGVVKDALILKDLPYGMGHSALEAVRQWRFAPATRNGEPVDVLFNLTVNFKLR